MFETLSRKYKFQKALAFIQITYDKNLFTINLPFQDPPTGPFEGSQHHHYQGSVREDDETFEQVIISQHQYFQKVEIYL